MNEIREEKLVLAYL